jgi:hypothetical protein
MPKSPIVTTATLNTQHDFITLRVRFTDGIAVNITESRGGIKVTSSSPALLATLKADGLLHTSFNALRKIEDAFLPNETVGQKMERFRGLAEESDSLIDFVEKAKLT